MKRTHHHTAPQLRTLDIAGFQHQGRPALLLRDPLRLGDNHVVLPREIAPALSLMDGTSDLYGMHAELLLSFGVNVPVDVLQQLVDVLDENYLLNNERAAEAKARALHAYRSAPFRPPMMAGQSYPAEPDRLARLLDGYLASVNGAGPASASGRGVISPHIDYPRGGAVYAAVWKCAAEMARAADLVILLGTDHYSTGDRITLTRQSYATPYGVLPTDVALVDALAAAIGEQAAFAGELRHRGEHSLELVATWLHHMRGGQPVAMIPILTGSFMDYVMGRGDPASDPQLTAFLAVLGQAVAGRNVLVVASGDLAHVGPAFGGAAVDLAGRQRIANADDELTTELAAGRADGFFAAIKRTQDCNNVCGVSPFYLMLRLLGNAEGQRIAYDQCAADAESESTGLDLRHGVRLACQYAIIPTELPDMPYRPIAESELSVVADIQAQSFRFDPARYMEMYTTGGRIGWRELRLYDNDAGQPAAALTLFFRKMSLNGGELEAGLVASVGVPPEHRRRGHGRQMMQGLLEELHARRTPVSLLFPFSVAWYRSLGYGMANLSWHIEQPLRLLPDFPERLLVRRATAEDEAAIRACHERARLDPTSNGWLSRTDSEWEKRAFKPENERALFEVDGQVEGYLLYRLDWDVVEVVEWVATNERAWRGLLGFISAQGEQAKRLKANLPQQSPLLWTLREPYERTEEVVDFIFRRGAVLVNGFMLRVVHLEEALRQRRYPVDLSVDLLLSIDDSQLPANSQPLSLTIRDGRAEVHSGSEIRNPKYATRTNMATFSQLYAGVMTAEQARLTGALDGDDAACRAMTAAFAAAPFHMWPADWF